jgi:hypothetical protein
MSDVKVMNLWGEAVGEWWHGTTAGYVYRKCRCKACIKAKSDYKKSMKEQKRELHFNGQETWHGTENGFRYYSCRCEDCKLAKRAAKYGLSLDRLKTLLSRGRCKICGTNEPGGNGWVIDHDHSCCDKSGSCGKCVREILCGRCNTLIGFAQDDPEILKAAIDYIELHAA